MYAGTVEAQQRRGRLEVVEGERKKKRKKGKKKKKKTENEVNEKQNILFLQVLSFFLGFCGKHLEEASHVVLAAKNNSDSPWAVSYRYVNT